MTAKQLLPILLALAVSFALTSVALAKTVSGDDNNNGGGQAKIGICHKTGSATNPYVYVEVPEGPNAHDGHELDIRGVDGPEDCPTGPDVTTPEETTVPVEETTVGETTIDETTSPEETTGSTTPGTVGETTGSETTGGTTQVTVPEEVYIVDFVHVCTQRGGFETFEVINNGDETVSGELVTAFDSVKFNLIPGESTELDARVSQGSNPTAELYINGKLFDTLQVTFKPCDVEGGETTNETVGETTQGTTSEETTTTKPQTVPVSGDSPGIGQGDGNSNQIHVVVRKAYENNVSYSKAINIAYNEAINVGLSQGEAVIAANDTVEEVYGTEGVLPSTGGNPLVFAVGGLLIVGALIARRYIR